MEKWKVTVTSELPGNALAKLARQCHVTIWRGKKRPTKSQLIKLVAGKQALLCLLNDHITREVIEASRGLKMISNYAVGFDNIDVKTASKNGIIVTNTPNVLTQAVAEHTFALLISVARRIPEGDRLARSGKYRGWSPDLLLGAELKGKTLGIIGLGRIGSEVARIASRGFEMKVLYTSGHRDERIERETGAKFASKQEVLRNSDFVSLHVPLTPETRHLIAAKELNLMKKSSYLINTSRGQVVDEKALVSALRRKQIAGAALDVFEFEPRLEPGLAKLDNVVLTPHIASATIEARSAMAQLAVDNILAVMRGKPPLTPVK